MEEAVAGLAKGVFDYSEAKLSDLVRRLQEGTLAFVNDSETIELIKNQRTRPEYKLFRQYIKDSNLRLQLEMGYSLKALEAKPEKLHNLKEKILKRFGTNGVYVAQLSQMGILTNLVAHVLGKAPTEKDFEENIELILKNVERYVVFLKAEDDPMQISRETIANIYANKPNSIIIFSRGEIAVLNAEKVINAIKEEVKRYSFEYDYVQDLKQRFDFIVKQK